MPPPSLGSFLYSILSCVFSVFFLFLTKIYFFTILKKTIPKVSIFVIFLRMLRGKLLKNFYILFFQTVFLKAMFSDGSRESSCSQFFFQNHWNFQKMFNINKSCSKKKYFIIFFKFFLMNFLYEVDWEKIWDFWKLKFCKNRDFCKSRQSVTL